MKQLIFNADDFGYSRGANLAILDCHRLGILTSATIMAGMPGFEHAVEIAKATPTLGVGVHLTLTAGRPVLEGHKSLVLDDGEFPRLGHYKDKATVIDVDEVEREWEAQISRVLKAGITPTHLDSHHHIHSYKGLGELFVDLAKRHDLPMRNRMECTPGLDARGVPQPGCLVDPLSTSGVTGDMNLRTYRATMLEGTAAQIGKMLESHDCVEVMTHPAYCDYRLMTGSSFNTPRVVEADLLMSDDTRRAIEALGDIELVSYRCFKQ